MPENKKARATPAEKTVANTPAKLDARALQEISGSMLDRVLAQVTAAEPLTYLSVDKRGQPRVGREREAVDTDNELFVWEVLSAEKGYICWEDGRPKGEETVSVFDDPVNPETLPDLGPFAPGDGWREQVKLTGDRLSTGQRVQFSPTSQGGRKTVNSLIKQVILAMKEQGRRDLVAITSWKLGSYEHQRYGEVPTADLMVEAIVPEAEAAQAALDLMEARAA